MLSRADDYPVHQTVEPIAAAGGGNRNFYDRYFFNGYARDGSVFFAAAMGQYPNREVVDAAFSVVHRGRQHVVRASRHAVVDRMESRVGPIAVEVREPLRAVRLIVEPNQFGISADLVFTGRSAPIEEPRFRREHAGHAFMDSTRLTQHVEIAGEICVGDERLAIDARHYWGSRDRSWGIRPVGERDADTPAMPAQFFWLWSPVNFDDLCTHFDVNEDADGTRWHQAGMIAPVGGVAENAAAVDYRLAFRPGTRHASGATVLLRRASGEPLEITLTPLLDFYMVGIGYTHPIWGHGMRVGDESGSGRAVVDGESWALAEVDPALPMHLHVQTLCHASCGARRGIGVLEQLILGPHAPSGFRELLDMA